MSPRPFPSTPPPVDPVNDRRFVRLSAAALLSLSQAGNEGASHCLIVRHQELIRTLAKHLTANPADADDLVSETYLRLFTVLNSCRNVDTLPAWIKRITRNECYRLYNLRRRRQAVVSLDHLTEIAGDHFLPTTSNDPARMVMGALEGAERLRRLGLAVGSLPESSRLVVEMFYLRDQSYDQIANQTGLHVGTIKSRMFRARKELQRRLHDLLPGDREPNR